MGHQGISFSYIDLVFVGIYVITPFNNYQEFYQTQLEVYYLILKGNFC